jgi:hypothetical protein
VTSGTGQALAAVPGDPAGSVAAPIAASFFEGL